MSSIFESARLTGVNAATSSSPRLRIPSRNTLLFLGLSLLWYSCSFLAASTSKALLSSRKVTTQAPVPLHDLTETNITASTSSSHINTSASTTTTYKTVPLFPYPVSLTAVQFVFVFTFSYTLCSPTIARHVYRWIGRPAPRDPDTGRARGLMSTLVMVDGPKLREMARLSVFNVAGHAMSAAAIQMVPVSTVHTIKALAPLFTVLSYVFILHLSYPLRTYISLAPLTIGVILACSGLSTIEGSRAWLGVIMSVGSTIVFVAQNLWCKKLLGHALSGAPPSAGHGAGNIKLDQLNLLFWSSGCSSLLMIPLFIYSDLPKLIMRSPHAGPGGLDLHSSIANATDAAMLHSIPTRAVTASFGEASTSSSTWRIIQLLVSNGSVHFAQSLLAFSILGLTTPVTYSIASLFKRVFVICFAIIWFGQTVSSLQWVGIVLTFVGLYLYNDSKQKPTSSAATSVLDGGQQSMAAKEEDAAQGFTLERGSRRRAGILPMSGGTGGNGITMPQMAASAGMPSGGPIWKGMSSSLIAPNGNTHHHNHQDTHPDAKHGPKRD